MTKFKNTVALIALIPALLATGCSLVENQMKIDRDSNLEFQDYRDSLAPREIPPQQSGKDVPDFQDYAVDTAKDLRPMPLVTISVNESVPLKDVLYELAQQANYDIELDPRIEGAVIFSARNKPFDQVMERICAMSGLRYKIVDDAIRIELDTPYTETYKIDYLAMVRTINSRVQNDATFSGDSEDSSSSTGSTFTLEGQAQIDFWRELDLNIAQILESNSPENALRTRTTPTLNPLPAPASATPPAAPAAAGGAGAPAGGAAPGAPTPPAGLASADPNAIPPAVIAQTAQPTTPPAVTGRPSSAGEGPELAPPTYSINRQAGLVSVFANERTQKKIRSYLEALRKAVNSQVLIEAKVFEVELSDEFANGIQWDTLESLGDFSFDFTSGPWSLTPSTTAGSSFVVDGDSISGLVQAVSRFGTVRALASPRLTVLNNQSAVLNVARNQTYFEIEAERETDDDTGDTTINITSTQKSVPEGILVNVTPTINTDNGEVMMTIRPTVTKIEEFVSDPGFQLFAASEGLTGVDNLVPNLSVKEFDSAIKMKSGEVAVLGGLLQDRSESEQNGIPVLSEAPLVGGLFRRQEDKVSKTELVVFMRATIVENGGKTIHQTDRDLYRIYSRDRRPFPL